MSALDELLDITEWEFEQSEQLWYYMGEESPREASAELAQLRAELARLQAERETEKRAYIQYQSYEVALRAELDKKDVRIEELDMALKMMHFGKDDR